MTWNRWVTWFTFVLVCFQSCGIFVLSDERSLTSQAAQKGSHKSVREKRPKLSYETSGNVTAINGRVTSEECPHACPRCGCDRTQVKCLVVVTVTRHYLVFFVNWLRVFQRLGLHVDLQIVSDDMESCQWLTQGNGQNYIEKIDLKTTVHCNWNATLPDEMNYGSKGFKEIMYRRGNVMLRSVMKRCCVIFSDLDVFWLRDPLHQFRRLATADGGKCAMLAQEHGYAKTVLAGRSVQYNPGLLVSFWGNNAVGVAIMRRWAQSMTKPSTNLELFNSALKKEKLVRGKKEYCFLPSKYFPEGNVMNFTQEWMTKHNPYLVHSCWMSSIDKKIASLKKIGLYEDIDIDQEPEENWFESK